jgi:hypothetical protein
LTPAAFYAISPAPHATHDVDRTPSGEGAMKKKAKKGSAKGTRKSVKDLTAKKASSVKGGVINGGITPAPYLKIK